jgi:uncharacterized damage-inducible protein DinB
MTIATSALEHHRRLLGYDRWANAEALRSLQQFDAPPLRALRWLAHVVGAEHLWLARLRGEASPLPVWPDLNPDGCAARLAELDGLWPAYLAPLAPGDLGRPVAYRNTKGESWTSTVGDILTHVVLHSAYHRGQIAAEVRAAGGEPAYTDFIHAVRQGLVE